MLGLILIYLIGKKFYDLASIHNKNKWGYAISGVASYYFGAFIGGIFLAIYMEFWSSTAIDIEELSTFTLTLIAIPFGLLSCFGLYKILQWNLRSKSFQLSPDILDEGFAE